MKTQVLIDLLYPDAPPALKEQLLKEFSSGALSEDTRASLITAGNAKNFVHYVLDTVNTVGSVVMSTVNQSDPMDTPAIIAAQAKLTSHVFSSTARIIDEVVADVIAQPMKYIPDVVGLLEKKPPVVLACEVVSRIVNQLKSPEEEEIVAHKVSQLHSQSVRRLENLVIKKTITPLYKSQEQMQARYESAVGFVMLSSAAMRILPGLNEQGVKFQQGGLQLCHMGYVAAKLAQGGINPILGIGTIASGILDILSLFKKSTGEADYLQHSLEQIFKELSLIAQQLGAEIQIVQGQLAVLTHDIRDFRHAFDGYIETAYSEERQQNLDNFQQNITIIKHNIEHVDYPVWLSKLADFTRGPAKRACFTAFSLEQMTLFSLATTMNRTSYILDMIGLLTLIPHVMDVVSFKPTQTDQPGFAHPLFWMQSAMCYLGIRAYAATQGVDYSGMPAADEAMRARIENLRTHGSLQKLIDEGEAVRTGLLRLLAPIVKIKGKYLETGLSFCTKLLARNILGELSAVTDAQSDSIAHLYRYLWNTLITGDILLEYKRLEAFATFLNALTLLQAWVSGETPVELLRIGLMDPISQVEGISTTAHGFHGNVHCFSDIADIIIAMAAKNLSAADFKINVTTHVQNYFTSLCSSLDPSISTIVISHPIAITLGLLDKYKGLLENEATTNVEMSGLWNRPLLQLRDTPVSGSSSGLIGVAWSHENKQKELVHEKIKLLLMGLISVEDIGALLSEDSTNKGLRFFLRRLQDSTRVQGGKVAEAGVHCKHGPWTPNSDGSGMYSQIQKNINLLSEVQSTIQMLQDHYASIVAEEITFTCTDDMHKTAGLLEHFFEKLKIQFLKLKSQLKEIEGVASDCQRLARNCASKAAEKDDWRSSANSCVSKISDLVKKTTLSFIYFRSQEKNIQKIILILKTAVQESFPSLSFASKVGAGAGAGAGSSSTPLVYTSFSSSVSFHERTQALISSAKAFNDFSIQQAKRRRDAANDKHAAMKRDILVAAGIFVFFAFLKSEMQSLYGMLWVIPLLTHLFSFLSMYYTAAPAKTKKELVLSASQMGVATGWMLGNIMADDRHRLLQEKNYLLELTELRLEREALRWRAGHIATASVVEQSKIRGIGNQLSLLMGEEWMLEAHKEIIVGVIVIPIMVASLTYLTASLGERLLIISNQLKKLFSTIAERALEKFYRLINRIRTELAERREILAEVERPRRLAGLRDAVMFIQACCISGLYWILSGHEENVAEKATIALSLLIILALPVLIDLINVYKTQSFLGHEVFDGYCFLIEGRAIASSAGAAFIAKMISGSIYTAAACELIACAVAHVIGMIAPLFLPGKQAANILNFFIMEYLPVNRSSTEFLNALPINNIYLFILQGMMEAANLSTIPRRAALMFISAMIVAVIHGWNTASSATTTVLTAVGTPIAMMAGGFFTTTGRLLCANKIAKIIDKHLLPDVIAETPIAHPAPG